MPKLAPDQLPAYRLHKQSGQAIVTLSGRDFKLGPYDSPDSRRRYERLTGEWIANGRRLPASVAATGRPPAAAAAGPSLASVAAAYWTHAQAYYAGSRGELGAIKAAIRVLVTLYPAPDDAAGKFGPLALKRVRDDMIRRGWCRNYVNAQTNRLRRLVKWAVENELMPPAVLQGLQAVAGLRAGKSPARESAPVKPVAEDHVSAVYPHVSRQVRGMIELQLVTGMRPGEACQMRGADLDTSGRLWTYRPPKHKTAHHGYARVVYLGPRAQELLAPFLKPDLAEYLFCPADADRERRARLTAQRLADGTPQSCGNRPGTNRRARPRRKPGARYTAGSYRTAIQRACDRAFPPPADALADPGRLAAWRDAHRWHPNQLRHNAATRIRREFGLEAAGVILGHETLSVTEIYAEKNAAAAMRIVAQVG